MVDTEYSVPSIVRMSPASSVDMSIPRDAVILDAITTTLSLATLITVPDMVVTWPGVSVASPMSTPTPSLRVPMLEMAMLASAAAVDSVAFPPARGIVVPPISIASEPIVRIRY